MKKLLSVLLALMLLVLPAFAAAAPSADASSADTLSADGSSGGFSPLWTSQEWAVLRLTNIERLNRNLAPLTMTAEALEAARTRCRELKSSVSHTRPDGRECFSVLGDLGIGVSFAGENVAAGQSDAYDVVHAWMNSENHRANILDGSFSHLGASYLAGALDDPYGSYWAQVFFDDYCRFSSLSLIDADGLTVSPGTSIDDMRVIAQVECAVHGTSYLPVVSQMCAGYDPDAPGVQTVTVTFRSLAASFSVEVRKDADSPTPAVSSSGAISVFRPISDYYYLFGDIPAGAWYYDDVYLSVLYGLMRGVTTSSFRPDAPLTVAQTLMIAARVRDLYDGGTGEIPQDSDPWYAAAVRFCTEHGIIAPGDFPEPDRAASRAEVAYILARTLPASELNAITSADAISDVAPDDPHAAEIYSLYRAGILTGDDTGAFHGSETIRRCEAAAILVRLILPARRIG